MTTADMKRGPMSSYNKPDKPFGGSKKPVGDVNQGMNSMNYSTPFANNFDQMQSMQQ